MLLPVERGREGTGGSAVAALTNGKAEGEEEEVGSRKPRRTESRTDADGRDGRTLSAMQQRRK